jgi:hypothetical protein
MTTDSINTNRASLILLEDGSIIELNLMINLSTDSESGMASERLNSEHMSKTLSLLEYMLITACKHSKQDIAAMIGGYGKSDRPQ